MTATLAVMREKGYSDVDYSKGWERQQCRSEVRYDRYVDGSVGG